MKTAQQICDAVKVGGLSMGNPSEMRIVQTLVDYIEKLEKKLNSLCYKEEVC